jgi:ribosomal protein S18 acetylase RimI-like enzyme
MTRRAAGASIARASFGLNQSRNTKLVRPACQLMKRLYGKIRAVTIAYRMLGSADTAVLDRVADDLFDEAIQPALAREFLTDSRHHLAVAIDGGLVVGFASGVHYVHPDKPAELWINEVGVAPSHQQRGVAKELLRTLLCAARELGCTQAWVLTDRDNTAAMRLYAAAGGDPGSHDHVMFDFKL